MTAATVTPIRRPRPARPADLAEDRIIDRWCPVLAGGIREQAGWRFDCPGCGEHRRLSVQAKGGRYPEWNTPGCGCTREHVRGKLADLGILTRRSPPKRTVDPGELTALVLAGLPPQSLSLGLLELAGIPTREALDKLGVSRTNRYRVVSALRQNRRS